MPTKKNKAANQPTPPHPGPPVKGSITDQAQLLALAAKDPKVLQGIHGQGFSGQVLKKQCGHFTGESVLAKTAQDFEIEVQREMQPRDPLERMLIDQLIWTHVRIGRLSMVAVEQSGLKQIQVVHEATDRALNTFRRLMLALQEYRNPRPGPSFTAIKQQNVALLNNAPAESENSKIKSVTNEKENAHASQSTNVLPAETGSVSLPAQIHPAHQAVAVDNRPENV